MWFFGAGFGGPASGRSHHTLGHSNPLIIFFFALALDTISHNVAGTVLVDAIKALPGKGRPKPIVGPDWGPLLVGVHVLRQ